jgi:hypothetical protein
MNYTNKDAEVLTFSEWCKLNRISEATGWRLKRSGKGPVFVRVGIRRIGVTVAANRAWQKKRSIR